MASKLDQHRDAIVQGLKAGVSQRQLARDLGVGKSTLQEFVAQHLNGARAELPDEPAAGIDAVQVIHRHYEHLDKLHVYPLGDLHLGDPSHDAETWAAWLNYLKATPHASLLNTGDNLNAALKDSKSEAYDELYTVGDAKRRFQAQLKPLAAEGRLDLLMPGNHEARIYRAVGDCPIKDVAFSLEAPYAQVAALVVYHVGDVEYEVYVRHGTGTGTSLNQLHRSSQVIDADVYVSGHNHSQTVTSDTVFVRDGDRVIRKRRLYVASGSFLGYAKYAAERAYTPGRIGAPRIYLDGRRKDAHVSI